MIFLTVGNWYKGFDRLVEAVDNLKCADVITEDVVAQIGHGNYRPKNLRFIEYCSLDDFARAIEKSLAEDNPERMASQRNKVKDASLDSKAQLVLDAISVDAGGRYV